MKITCHHSQSSYGVPVILDGRRVLDYPEGLTRVLELLGWSRADAAREAGYKARSIEKYWQGVTPSARFLNRLAVELEKMK